MRFLFNDEMYDPVNISSNLGSNFPRSIYFDFLIWDKIDSFSYLLLLNIVQEKKEIRETWQSIGVTLELSNFYRRLQA